MSAAGEFRAGPWRMLGWGVVLAGLAVQAWMILCNLPGVQWNAPRLAPAFALWHGLPIYALRDSGAHLGWFYGPVFPLWYAPLAWIPNITAFLVAAGVWNLATYLVPIYFVLRVAGLADRWRFGMLLTAVVLVGHAVTFRHFLFIHVDVVAFVFGTVACLAVHRAMEQGNRRWWHVAGLALAAACWTKQLAVGLYPGILWWMWREAGAPTAARFALWAAGYAAAVSLAVLAAFGMEEVLFNAVLVQLRTPAEGGWEILGQRLGQLALGSLAWVPLGALAWRAHAARAVGPSAARLNRLFWTLAIWQLPLGLSASIKIGGGLNSVHSLHYALLALLVLALQRVPAQATGWRPAVVATVWCLAFAAPLVASIRHAAEMNPVWRLYRNHEELVQLARAERGRIYLPWNPLITLMTERRILPFDNALYCLWLARLLPPDEKIRSAMPLQPIFVYEEPAQSRFAHDYYHGRVPPSRP